MMKYFDFNLVKNILRQILKTLGWLIVVMLVGIVIGFTISGQNPFKVFLPSTWWHIVEFLK